MSTQLVALLVMVVSAIGLSIGNCLRNRNEKLGRVMVWGLAFSTLLSLLILVHQTLVHGCV